MVWYCYGLNFNLKCLIFLNTLVHAYDIIQQSRPACVIQWIYLGKRNIGTESEDAVQVEI